MKTICDEKYETMYDYALFADISHYSMSASSIPVWPGVVWVDSFKPRDDPDFTTTDTVNGEDAPPWYVWVNWGEDHWVLLKKSALDDEMYARYEYWDGEFNSIGGVFETEEDAWNGWKSVDEMYTPNINDENVTKEIEEFIESMKISIYVDEKGYIWLKDYGYFEDIESLVDIMNCRKNME